MMRGARATEQGSILVLAMLLALVLLGFGLAAMWMAASSVRSRTGADRREEAMAAAEAGVERASGILESHVAWDTLLGGCSSCSGNDLARKGNVLCFSSACLRDVEIVPPPAAATGSAPPPRRPGLQYSIWIRNDWGAECGGSSEDLTRADCDGDGRKGTLADRALALKDRNGRVIVLVEGRTRGGRSTVRLEVVFTRARLPADSAGYLQEGLGSSSASSLRGGLLE